MRMLPSTRRWLIPAALALLVLFGLRGAAARSEPEPELKAMVEEDWARQEQRWGREVSSVEALKLAVERGVAWLERRGERSGEEKAPVDTRAGEELRRVAAAAEGLDVSERLEWYRRVRWLTRQWALADAGIGRQPLVFLQRNRFICQMLHEYMGYFQDYGGVAGGGGVFILERPGVSLRVRDVLSGRLPPGNYTTLALSFAGDAITFAFAERSATKPDFYSPEVCGN